MWKLGLSMSVLAIHEAQNMCRCVDVHLADVQMYEYVWICECECRRPQRSEEFGVPWNWSLALL